MIPETNRKSDPVETGSGKPMNRRKFAAGMAGVILLLCSLCMAAVLILDPFYHYHKPWFGLKAVLNEKEYQVPGSLRHFDYDMVVVGSSVVENNDNRWYDEAFDGKTIKAVRSYGGIADLAWYLNLAFESQDVKRVFFNIDPSSLIQEAETTFEASGCPMYLYDRNPFNDVNYLLNKTVILEKIPYMLAESFSSDYDEGLSYNWAEGKDFSEQGALSHYERVREVQPMLPGTAYAEELRDNTELLLEIIRTHPDTIFCFFFPPYSMIWWDDAIRKGMQDVYLYDEERITQVLLSCENVRVFDFQNDTDIVTDLNLYMDAIHFSPAVNEKMCFDMAEGRCEVTEQNLQKTFQITRKQSLYFENNQIADLNGREKFIYKDME